MKFAIQLGNPRWIHRKIDDRLDIGDAVADVFCSDTEYVIMSRKHVPIVLDYRYDVYVIMPDVVDFMEEMIKEREGGLKVRWGSNTFDGIWHIDWLADVAKVEAEWFSVIGGHERCLNKSRVLLMGKWQFLGEWATLLEYVHRCVTLAGVRLIESDELRIKSILKDVSSRGVLYSGGRDEREWR